ncbi:MAG: thrombospondin type 3 repeat-containing protein [Candidatus Peribacteria bacterium]|nr:MAG: thrombospondin type 3 repeat-containing protein [Candidatus Peribacteria bacterium]
MVSVPVFLYAQYTTYVPIEPAVIHKALETNTRSNPRGYLGFNNLSCSLDNCPFIANTDQIDTNLNGVGNICEALIIIDTDGDGIPDDEDECPTDPTNTCTTTTIDTDGDGIPDDEDSCPLVYGYVQYNGCPGDGDIITGSTTIVIDTDGDGIPDDEDECPTDPTNTCTTTTTTTTTTGSTISNTQLLLGFDACEDTQPHITITECNLCPCQYA